MNKVFLAFRNDSYGESLIRQDKVFSTAQAARDECEAYAKTKLVWVQQDECLYNGTRPGEDDGTIYTVSGYPVE